MTSCIPAAIFNHARRAGCISFNGLNFAGRHFGHYASVVCSCPIGKKYYRSRLRCPAPTTGRLKLANSRRAEMVQCATEEIYSRLQAKRLDKYLRDIHRAPGLRLKIIPSMLIIVPGKTGVIIAASVGRKAVQVFIALFFPGIRSISSPSELIYLLHFPFTFLYL